MVEMVGNPLIWHQNFKFTWSGQQWAILPKLKGKLFKHFSTGLSSSDSL